MSEEAGFRLPEQHVLHGVFSDVTKTGIITVRLIQHLLELAHHTDLSDDERAQFLPILVMVANKLGAVWYHKENYKRVEAELAAKAEANPIEPKAKRAVIDCSPELFYEFDAFLVQAKSCLDHLVKIPRPFVGRAWNLTTFGARGQDVLNAVRRNMPARFANSSKGFLMLLATHLPWLEELIRARDKINHLQEGGVPPQDFSVFAIRATPEQVNVHLPKWSPDQAISAYVDITWANLYRFVEDFVGLSISQRLQPEKAVLHRPVPLDRLDAVWLVTTRELVDRTVANPGWVKYTPPSTEGNRSALRRKDPCRCGSGKQYRKCCLSSDQAKARAARA